MVPDRLLLCVAVWICTSPVQAEPESAKYPEWIKAATVPGTIVTACGVTRDNRPIPALVTKSMLDVTTKRSRILIIAGFESSAETIQSALKFWQQYHTEDRFADLRKCVDIAMIPVANPDGAALGLVTKNSAGGIPDERFPPAGTAYSDPRNPEASYLWRWIGMLGPDGVIVMRPGDRSLVRLKLDDGIYEVALDVSDPKRLPMERMGRLFIALPGARPAGLGPFSSAPRVSAFEVVGPSAEVFLEKQMRLRCGDNPAHVPQRRELLRRKARTPIQIATELSKVYGHQLNSVAYIPALALIGRLRLGELTAVTSHLADVERIVQPYFDASKPTMGQRVGGSTMSGHLVFGELATRTKKPRYTELTQAVADLGFDESGAMREAMPHHVEMSDSVFMGGPILVQAGRLTGESKYFDMAMRHLRFMLKLNLRKDGLHQHSPLDPAGTAWGRGNGFPALGLALCLSDLPADSPHRDEMLKIYRKHMAAMVKHQDEMGMWHQVVDHPESYREFTVTCMTTFALTRGLRRGWLDAKTYQSAVERAWEAIKCRIGPDGNLVDVCTGTGKQKSFRDYLDRTAILGRDDRGGAMALMVATEIAFAQRERILSGTAEHTAR